jgi:predicted nuclease of restriction endonuclease-like (RecB) superfamily/uncharacterized protein (DUF302 family)
MDFDLYAWHAAKTVANRWSVRQLQAQIQLRLHERQGSPVSNFAEVLGPPDAQTVLEVTRDPYVFDFLELAEDARERHLEQALIEDIQNFLIELGTGFAFYGRQRSLLVGDREFFPDLIFFHHTLRRFVVIELKVGAFQPEYVSKMNFYLNAVDEQLRVGDDQESVGIILCAERNERRLSAILAASPTQPPGIWPTRQDDLSRPRKTPPFIEPPVPHRRCLQTTRDTKSVGLVENRPQHRARQTLTPALRVRRQHPQIPMRLRRHRFSNSVVVARQTSPRLLTRNRAIAVPHPLGVSRPQILTHPRRVPHRHPRQVIRNPHVPARNPHIKQRPNKISRQTPVLLPEDERPPRVLRKRCRDGRHHAGAVLRQRLADHLGVRHLSPSIGHLGLPPQPRGSGGSSAHGSANDGAGSRGLTLVFLLTRHNWSSKMPDASPSETTELTTKTSPRSVADTVARLESLAREKGMKVFAVIDHSGEARQAGLQLRETKVVIFGSPQAGTPVMAAAPLAALDLPLKVLVWDDDDGQTQLTYTAPSTLAARYGLDQELAGRLAGIDGLTDGAIGE